VPPKAEASRAAGSQAVRAVKIQDLYAGGHDHGLALRSIRFSSGSVTLGELIRPSNCDVDLRLKEVIFDYE